MISFDILKKRKFAIIGLVVLLILTIMIGVNFYKSQERSKYIDAQLNQIVEVQKNFTETDTREEKTKILQSFLSTYETYKISDTLFDEITESYEKEIGKMRNFFFEKYDEEYKKNALENLGEIKDKNKIKNAKDELQKLLSTLDAEQKIVSTETDIKKFKEKIEALITTYEKRLDEIVENDNSEISQKTELNNTVKENTNSGNASNSSNNQSSSGNNSTSGDSTNSEEDIVEAPKAPKPALGTVVQANDFPKDGWSWYRNTYCWIPSLIDWGGVDGTELANVEWQISPNSNSMHIDVLLMARENARKFMPPAPTLEQSKSLIKHGQDSGVKYGLTTVYVSVG